MTVTGIAAICAIRIGMIIGIAMTGTTVITIAIKAAAIRLILGMGDFSLAADSNHNAAKANA